MTKARGRRCTASAKSCTWPVLNICVQSRLTSCESTPDHCVTLNATRSRTKISAISGSRSAAASPSICNRNSPGSTDCDTSIASTSAVRQAWAGWQRQSEKRTARNSIADIDAALRHKVKGLDSHAAHALTPRGRLKRAPPDRDPVGPLGARREKPGHDMKVQASVARCLRTPPYAARRKGLSFGITHRLRGECYRSMVVICNYTLRTDNGGISPGQSRRLYTFVDPVSAPWSCK